ncbi:unnamed protein product [Psylliodes chrysocephalus]|uniref:PHD-type domain-containing protein n=1 Tax=Psylliodes chrysocephalus TaxID=3402493 RepID=A0A9P0GDW6_9CUCU|nr:unnamed protein product [Psylliodes chrysocephala]
MKKRDENLIGCEGPCGSWFHPECYLMDNNDFKVIHKLKNIYFICNSCKTKIEIVDKKDNENQKRKISNIDSNFSKLITEQVTKAIFDQFRDEITQKLESCFEAIQEKIKDAISTNSSNIAEPSYANVASQSKYILQPKINITQLVSTTKSEMVH